MLNRMTPLFIVRANGYDILSAALNKTTESHGLRRSVSYGVWPVESCFVHGQLSCR